MVGCLLASRDGRASYAVVNVTNSYGPNTEYNNFTSIEGALVKHPSGIVDLVELPTATTFVDAPQSHIAKDDRDKWQIDGDVYGCLYACFLDA